MANITIKDLEMSKALDKQTMASIRGGWFFWPYKVNKQSNVANGDNNQQQNVNPFGGGFGSNNQSNVANGNGNQQSNS